MTCSMPSDLANIDVTTLSQHDASEFRRELMHAIFNPGIEFDMVGEQYEADRKVYWAKVKECDVYLQTFPDVVF